MDTVLNAFSACFVLLLIMAVGYFMGRKGWMGPPEKVFLSKYIMTIAVPCLCIRGLVTNLDRESLVEAGADFLADTMEELEKILLG